MKNLILLEYLEQDSWKHSLIATAMLYETFGTLLSTLKPSALPICAGKKQKEITRSLCMLLFSTIWWYSNIEMLIGHRSGRMTKATFLGLENVNHVCLLFLDLSSDHGTMPMALPLVLRATLGLYDFEMGNKCSLILAKGPRRSNSTSGSNLPHCCRLPTHQK